MPTTATIATATPEHSSASRPEHNPNQSRRSIGPSWSASSSCAQPERERAGERDLERVHDVLRAGAEEQHDSGDDRRDPGIDTGAAHHRPGERGDRDVREHAQEHVREVRAQPDRPPERAPGQNRQRRPVVGVRPEEVAEVPRGAVREEVPLVEEEPLVPREREIERNRRDGQHAEHRQRPARTALRPAHPGSDHSARRRS